MPIIQQIINVIIGNSRSTTVPLPFTVSGAELAYGRSGVVYKSPFAALASCTAIAPKSILNKTIVSIAIIVSNA